MQYIKSTINGKNIFGPARFFVLFFVPFIRKHMRRNQLSEFQATSNNFPLKLYLCPNTNFMLRTQLIFVLMWFYILCCSNSTLISQLALCKIGQIFPWQKYVHKGLVVAKT